MKLRASVAAYLFLQPIKWHICACASLYGLNVNREIWELKHTLTLFKVINLHCCITTSRVKEGNPAVLDPCSLGSHGHGCHKTSPVRVGSNISLLRWRGAHLPQAAISNEVIIDSIFLYAPSSFHLKLTTKLSWLSSRCRIFQSFTYRGREERVGCWCGQTAMWWTEL